jgi:acyl carrier protein
MEQSVIDTIREFVVCNFLFDESIDVLPDDASLLKLGIIDSTGVLSLLLFTEEQFGIEVPDTDVTPEHFDSVERLAAYVNAKLAEQAVSV